MGLNAVLLENQSSSCQTPLWCNHSLTRIWCR